MLPMNLIVTAWQGVVVIEPRGNVCDGWETSRLREEVTSRFDAGDRRFLIDLGSARLVNFAGIGVLVALFCQVVRAGGEFKICSVGERTRRALAHTGLGKVLDVHPSRGEALRSFEIHSPCQPGTGSAARG
jgi:anti-sigma B factor antagonist